VRGANGQFIRSDTTRRIYEQPFTGLRSKADAADQLPPAFAYLQEQLDALIARCIADEGVPEADIPVRRKKLIEYSVRLHRRILQLDTALEIHGITDRRGKLRATWLTKLANLIAIAKGLDVVLGLERRSRDIGSLSLAEYAAIDHNSRAEPGSNADAVIDHDHATSNTPVDTGDSK
jgi:hypothetical protein